MQSGKYPGSPEEIQAEINLPEDRYAELFMEDGDTYFFNLTWKEIQRLRGLLEDQEEEPQTLLL